MAASGDVEDWGQAGDRLDDLGFHVGFRPVPFIVVPAGLLYLTEFISPQKYTLSVL